jgi:hypothetical protein
MSAREPGLLQALADLVRGWWLADRVRISPDEGRLLDLRLPCLLRVRGSVAQALARQTGHGANGPYVVYSCTDDVGDALLWVYPVGRTTRPLVRWQTSRGEMALSGEDVEVYG